MNIAMEPGRVRGRLRAIPSKSHLHRQLICAALAPGRTRISCKPAGAQDIAATIDCLQALGAEISISETGYEVKPIDFANLPEACELPCKESGSTFRFLLPIVCALGVTGDFLLEGRLPERPLAPLDSQLTSKGIVLSRPSPGIVRCEGRLEAGSYSLRGDVSSQYISGLLLALPLLRFESTLEVTGEVQSGDYIAMTLAAQEAFGIKHELLGKQIYAIKGGGYESPSQVRTEGDWSNGAFWLCCGAMPDCRVTLEGLDQASFQGDRQVMALLTALGADVGFSEAACQVGEGKRLAIDVDAGPIPDLIPVLCAVLAVSKGTSRVYNARRLRFKESDRLATTAGLLNALGANVTELEDGLVIQGVPALKGGRVDACGDHRIAMLGAAVSLACREAVVLTGAEAVRKSYPGLWEDLASLGKTLKFLEGGETDGEYLEK